MSPSKKPPHTVATGRRKTAVASVYLRNGSGRAIVNGKDLADYFPTEILRRCVIAPLAKLALEKQYDLTMRLRGGGLDGQAVAAQLGISRALVLIDETRKVTLKQEGYLTRDPRRRERKKYGRPGARKSFQFSKR